MATPSFTGPRTRRVRVDCRLGYSGGGLHVLLLYSVRSACKLYERDVLEEHHVVSRDARLRDRANLHRAAKVLRAVADT